MNLLKAIKILGLTILGILIFNKSFSQKNYVPGYVINLEGDTLSGFIDYRNWRKNPNKVRFKKTIDTEPIVYTPININGFRAQDEIYLSGIVEAEVSSLKTNNLQENPTIHIKVDTTFLQALFIGDKGLYLYALDNKENFYIKQNSTFKLLIYKKYLKEYKGGRAIAENKSYLNQLSLYLNDCSSIQSKLKNTTYTLTKMKKLFQYYYECSQAEILFQKKADRISTEIGLLAGVSLSTINFKSDYFASLTDVDFGRSTNFSTGLFFDVIMSRNQGKWSINNELIFTSYQMNAQSENFRNENDYSITTTEIGYSYLKMNNLLRFKYPVKNLFLYINAGISNGIAISETNYQKQEIKFYSTDRVIEKNALNDTRKYEQGYIIGLGAKYNDFSIEMRYERGNGISEYSTLNSITTRYYFLLGYRF